MIESPNATSCVVLSIPRAGTHMLMKVMKLLGLKEFTPTGGVGIYNFNTMPPQGHFEYGGHFVCDMDPIAVIHQSGYKGVFIYRDPRDVIVSHAAYGIYDSKQQGSHPLYKMFDTHDMERVIDWLIDYEPYRFWSRMGWENIDGVYSTSYEYVWYRTKDEVRRIAKHLNIQLTDEQVSEIHREFPPDHGDQSYHEYFRQGVPGNWKQYFTEAHKKKCKEAFGLFLVNNGYEKDNNW
jgi:hypothetical protein